MSQSSSFLEPTDDGVRLRVKAVPGAKRDAIAGKLGDRLKIRVSAPPEDGKANRAIVSLLAKTLGIKTNQIELLSGQTNRDKLFLLRGVTLQQALAALG